MTRATWDETWLAQARQFGELRSACDRRRVGAVIVDVHNQVQATAYNGPPAGQPFDLEAGCLAWCSRARSAAWSEITDGAVDDDVMLSYRTCPSLHAEANALLEADRTKIRGGTIYVSSAVCKDCAKLVANSGLARVVMNVLPGDEHREPDKVTDYLTHCGLAVVGLRKEDR